jgi:hypothetical protein
MGMLSRSCESAAFRSDRPTMLIPAPPPAYTLSPALPPLSAAQHEALEACLAALTGDVNCALVTGVGRALGGTVFELATADGPVLVLGRGERSGP